ncbi:MAG TPA: NAD(P)-dependent oxidoreductase [Myxococcaceae bacterium]|jgi:nucleoside-diphosphate-sugar epimerase
MRVLVTGASGFIGRHLCRLLVRRGHAVTALVRRTSAREALAEAGARFVQGDLSTGEGLDGAVIEADWIFHLAGLTKARNEAEFHEVNARGTERLLEALLRRPPSPKVILCSSLAAAGPSRPGEPRREEDPPAPISAYGRSKLAAEDAVRQRCGAIPSVIVRPPIVYGPEEHELIPSFLPMLRAGVLLKSGFGRKEYSVVYVADLCGALVAAAERGRLLLPDGAEPERGVYFVSDGEQYAWEDICHAMAGAWGRPDLPVLPLPEWAGWPALAAAQLKAALFGGSPSLTRDKLVEMSAASWTCAIDQAVEELGFQPVYPLERGMQDTLDWFRRRQA